MDKTPIGFMSYARSDDAHENGKLSDFRLRLVGEVRMQSGDDSFDIFQDHIDIVWGQQWQTRLDNSLDSVKLLIPIITPKFFRSDACRAEVLRFVRREQQLGRDDLILPVYYVKASELEDKAKRDADEIARVIASHQHIDWRALRHELLTTPESGKMLDKMAQQIVATMERMVGRPAAQPVLVPPLEIIRPVPAARVQPAQAVLQPVAPAKPIPAWASAMGADQYGKWLEICIGNVVQRMRWIKPGNFLMGSPKSEAGRRDREGPQHRVTLGQGFWLADTACTQALWQAVMGKNPSHFHAGNRGGSEHPVEQVSWHDVQVFLKDAMKKLPGCQFSLPTEAEWEYACRAGSQTAFSFGEPISTDQINFDGNYPVGEGKKGEYRERTLPVTALPANGWGLYQMHGNVWGLYQMHGNVWEWCADGQRVYEDKAVADPGWADVVNPPGVGAAARVLRGGSWRNDARNARSAYRNALRPDGLDNDIGFRLACRSSG
jgi:formylglycine-generating enzyme required for sulfatase activity